MKILIVDDDRVSSAMLRGLLAKDGHDVATAANGRDGVDLFLASWDDRSAFDLVLMDVLMPGMNGYEAAYEIKKISGDRFIPIIFLTAVTDEEGLAKCVESGGDDFLTKPFNRILLQAKIDALERIRQLHALQRQELEVAEHLFNHIVRAGSLLDAPCLNHWTSPMSLFNGDLLVAAYNPAGGLHILLGDFTGHGLSAAVGALPLAEIFYGLTAQGLSIGDLVEAINAKLLDIMPTRMFCAACLIEVDARQQSLTVWNGGLPDVFLVDGEGRLAKKIPSSHLPLGVVPFTPDDRKVEILEMQKDYRVFLASDGLIESVNPVGTMYGQERLQNHFDGEKIPGQLFSNILKDLDLYRDGTPQTDDISLLEIVCASAGEDPPGGRPALSQKRAPPSAWEAAFSFSAETLKSVDPLPTLIQALMNIQSPSGHRERIYTILAELFSNSLDHGLLKLDTKTKQSPEGFLLFYAQREERLAALQGGFISIGLKHRPKNGGGVLNIRVEDSGEGFDTAHVQTSLAGNLGHGGRGIALVRSLCRELTFEKNGTIAYASYEWQYD